MINAIDLFSGAGGWACAAKGLPIRIVAAVDFWEPCTITYKLNFPDTSVLCSDVRDPLTQDHLIDIARSQDVQLVLGFPEDYLFYGSPADVMKQVGRAVPIPLARAILQAIVDANCKIENRKSLVEVA